jgi:outer membrane protein OmpA-like peptidoglycan-associated protein
VKTSIKTEENQMKRICYPFFFILPLFLFFASCGGPPAQNPLLEEANTAYRTAEQDENIVRYAPVALKEAEETLQISRRLWEAKADKVDVDHHAYLALQRTLIARETAMFNAAENEIGRAETERQQVLIEVRRSEAQNALERARVAEQDVQRQRASSERQAQRAVEDVQRERVMTAEAQQKAERLATRVGELEALQTERGLVLTLGDVTFEFNKATLMSGGMRTIRDLAKFMEEYPERNILIEGHTDNIGSDEYNQALSERRAGAVKQALVGLGISDRRIRMQGMGKTQPVASNNTEAGRQQNRRVEVIISDEHGNISVR